MGFYGFSIQIETVNRFGKEWNSWREANNFEKLIIDSENVNTLEYLPKLHLIGRETDLFLLKDFNFENVIFHGLNISNVRFDSCRFQDTKFESCLFSSVIFYSSNGHLTFNFCAFRVIQLLYNSFKNLVFNNSVIEGLEFPINSKLINVNFKNINFVNSRIEEHQSLIFNGKNSLDTNSIIKSNLSNLKLKNDFNIPDLILDNRELLIGQAINFYSLFLSHSSKDRPFVEKLKFSLQSNNVECWYSEDDLVGGKKTFDQISEAIDYKDKTIIILSENSIQSNWVKLEILQAYKSGNLNNKEKFFPISIIPFNEIEKWEYFDSDYGVDFAKKLREFHIPNFSDWENETEFNKEFSDLLKALKK